MCDGNQMERYFGAVYLKLGSAEPHGSANVCQGFRETKMRNDGKVFIGGPKFVYTN